MKHGNTVVFFYLFYELNAVSAYLFIKFVVINTIC